MVITNPEGTWKRARINMARFAAFPPVEGRVFCSDSRESSRGVGGGVREGMWDIGSYKVREVPDQSCII